MSDWKNPKQARWASLLLPLITLWFWAWDNIIAFIVLTVLIGLVLYFVLTA